MFNDDKFLNFLSGGDFGSASFFEINPQSVLGRNKILNFIGIIAVEVGTLGFSNNANEIAEFYDNLKSREGVLGIKKFFDNKVVQAIMQEMKNTPIVNRYLTERIFDIIKEDQINTLNDYFKNSKRLMEKIKKKENKQKEKNLKEINDKLSINYTMPNFALSTNLDLNKIEVQPCDFEEFFEKLKKYEKQNKSENVELDDNTDSSDDENNEFFRL